MSYVRTRMFHQRRRHPARASIGRWPRPAIASDSFVRANSATVGTTDGLRFEAGQEAAQTWAEDNGTWAITSNKCVLSGESSTARNLFDHGTADVWLETILQTTETGSGEGFVVRHNDDSNEWRVIIVPVTNLLRLVKVEAASTTTPISVAATITINVDYKLKCVAKGSNWYIEVRRVSTGALLASGSLTDSFNSTFTTHGLFGNVAGGDTCSFDRYLARRAYS